MKRRALAADPPPLPVLATLLLGALGGAGCHAGSTPAPAMSSAGGADGIDDGCADIFQQQMLPTYELELSPEIWRQLTADFLDGPPPDGLPKTYYPVVAFRYGAEVRTDARIRLKGDSSWRDTIALDANPKAQFVVSFDEGPAGAPFHGARKIDLDMPRGDPSMLNDRLASAFMRAAGLPAPCANSAQLYVGGQLYGLYVNEENRDATWLDRVFPGDSGGVLLKYGSIIEVNPSAYDAGRASRLWGARDVAGMLAANVDLDRSLRVWAAEAIINDADGYWGGDHNFYLYEHPQSGWRWLSDDLDTAFAWIGMMQHPIYWWAGRYWSPPVIPQHYLAVIGDAAGRTRFVAALADVLGRYDVAELGGWLDAWSAQIADAAERDPHRPFSIQEHQRAVAATRDELAARADYLRRFLSCEGGGGDAGDADGDGYPWCRDCDDAHPEIHPGAPEICGDGVDQNCDSVPDNGCRP